MRTVGLFRTPLRLSAAAALAAILAGGLTATAAPQEISGHLTADQIQAAIADGLKGKGRDMSLRLLDSAQGFFNAMAKPSDADRTGFSMEVYTPATWIKQQASDAAKEFRGFSSADVTPDMLAPVLRLIIHPDQPVHVIARDVARSSSVQHVVVRDIAKKVAVQPANKEAFDQSVSNAMGGSAAMNGLTATFNIEDLKAAGISLGVDEFYITIVGTAQGSNKDFEVKSKHFARLR